MNHFPRRWAACAVVWLAFAAGPVGAEVARIDVRFKIDVPSLRTGLDKKLEATELALAKWLAAEMERDLAYLRWQPAPPAGSGGGAEPSAGELVVSLVQDSEGCRPVRLAFSGRNDDGEVDLTPVGRPTVSDLCDLEFTNTDPAWLKKRVREALCEHLEVGENQAVIEDRLSRKVSLTRTIYLEDGMVLLPFTKREIKARSTEMQLVLAESRAGAAPSEVAVMSLAADRDQGARVSCEVRKVSWDFGELHPPPPFTEHPALGAILSPVLARANVSLHVTDYKQGYFPPPLYSEPTDLKECNAKK